jgi:hypothetical protein
MWCALAPIRGVVGGGKVMRWDEASWGRGDGDRGVHLRQTWVLDRAYATCNDNVWRFFRIPH